ncbi:MAG: ABC transporter substrate-binding protein, partial [Brachybacterium tyrofermentans]
TPQIQTAIDQLEVVRTQDYARVFLPGADQEMANSVGTILTAEGDVEDALTDLQATLEEIYSSQVEPKLS